MRRVKKRIKAILHTVRQLKLVKPFEVVKRKNITIVPFEELLDRPVGLSDHKGGPIWDSWNDTNNLRHRRFAFEDDRPAAPTSIDRIEHRPLFWCGAIVSHFGHQVADFTSRFVAYKIYEKDHNGESLYYCFAVKPDSGISRFEDTPAFFKQIIEWYEIKPEQIYIIDKPIKSRKLLVTPQLEVLALNGSPIPIHDQYIAFLGAQVEKNLGKAEKNNNIYYISRSKITGGELAGESYVDEFFQANGVSVVYPENLSLVEQIKLYRDAKALVFLEGSALHGLQFLGETSTSIYIINRRSGYRVMEDGFNKRFPHVGYHDITNLIHGLTPAGGLAKWDGISILDKDGFQQLVEALGLNFNLWRDDEFKQRELLQLKKWVERKKACPDTGYPDSIELIGQKLNEAGYDLI